MQVSNIIERIQKALADNDAYLLNSIHDEMTTALDDLPVDSDIDIFVFSLDFIEGN